MRGKENQLKTSEIEKKKKHVKDNFIFCEDAKTLNVKANYTARSITCQWNIMNT